MFRFLTNQSFKKVDLNTEYLSALTVERNIVYSNIAIFLWNQYNMKMNGIKFQQYSQLNVIPSGGDVLHGDNVLMNDLIWKTTFTKPEVVLPISNRPT